MTPQERRVSTWIDFVSDLLRAAPGRFPHGMISARLHDTFGTQVSWNWLEDDGRVGFDLHLPMEGWPAKEDMDLMASAIFDHPLVRWFDISGDPAPMSIGRVPRQLITPRARRVIGDVLVPIGMDAQLSIPYRLSPGSHHAYVLSRSREDFSNEDLLLARQIQTLLRLLDRQALVHEASPLAVCEGHELTGRELAVLRLLANGLTAAAIARRLGISPRTVHRHLDASYRKLGVRDRVGAVLAGRDAGLLPNQVSQHDQGFASQGAPAWSAETRTPATARIASRLYTYTARST
jgi:DNA-binding CsgD family transcriptional regulator